MTELEQQLATALNELQRDYKEQFQVLQNEIASLKNNIVSPTASNLGMNLNEFQSKSACQRCKNAKFTRVQHSVDSTEKSAYKKITAASQEKVIFICLLDHSEQLASECSRFEE